MHWLVFIIQWIEKMNGETLKIINTRIIKQFSSDTSCFSVCEATCFGSYMTIIRSSFEWSQEMLATCCDPKYVATIGQQTYLADSSNIDKFWCMFIAKWKQFIKHKHLWIPKLSSQHWTVPRLNNKPARNVTRNDKKHRTRVPHRSDTNGSTSSKLTAVLQATIRR